jgi:hypothetical protein
LLAVGAQAQEAPDTGSSIPGIPGEDYPLLAAPLDTSFICEGREVGYYADPEGECQQFHICVSDGLSGPLKFSFLCPNGTLFNQQYFICDWWFNVDCSQVTFVVQWMIRFSYVLKHGEPNIILMYILRQRISTS